MADRKGGLWIMIEKITEKGYAKINLHLDITGILPDGYHAVSTVMQSISLCDEITVSKLKITDGEPHFTADTNIDGLPCDERNLAVRAALLFCKTADISLSGHIHIEKNIPMAAGMAGGSTDGAAVLRALNTAVGSPLTTERLCAIASDLGADVPFCVRGGTAYADGKGDLLHSFPKMPDCAIVAACEGEGVSTPWAYRLLDERYNNFDSNDYTPRSIENLRSALLSHDTEKMAAHLYNIFEKPVLAERPVAAEIKEILTKNGALRAMMSGSGPSVFGIFHCPNCAKKAAEALKAKGYTAYICKPV